MGPADDRKCSSVTSFVGRVSPSGVTRHDTSTMSGTVRARFASGYAALTRPTDWHLGWALEQTGRIADAVSTAELAMAISSNPKYLPLSATLIPMPATSRRRHRSSIDWPKSPLRGTCPLITPPSSTPHSGTRGHSSVGASVRRAITMDAYLRVGPRIDSLRFDSRIGALLRQARLDF